MLLLPSALTLRAQDKAPPDNGAPTPAAEALTVASQGRDYRVVEWLTRETTDTGGELITTNSYTEIATGLHYPGPKGEWLETVAEFVPVAGGYLAARGPHQVALSTDLSTPGAVTVVTPDGQTLRSTPTLLAYVDRVSGKSVRLANLKPSKGGLTAPNVVLYTDAFDTLAADVRATYTAGAFESDVILRKQLPDPKAFGFDPETTDVAVYTEWFDTKPTGEQRFEQSASDGTGSTDARLDFGSMSMDRGKAFGLASDPAAKPESRVEVPVRKSWEQLDGRTFLIERTAYRDLSPLLQDLPEASALSPEQRALREKLDRTAKLDLPPRQKAPMPVWAQDTHGRLVASARTSATPFVATAAPAPRGVVLDYTLLNTTTNQTFDSLTTYYVSGPVNIGTNNATFNAGTVIKFASTNSASLNILSGTAFVWNGAPYRPVTLIGRDDNSAGEPLPSATGTPSGYYAATALSLNNIGAVTVTNLVVRNATLGLEVLGNTAATVRHAQFVGCSTGVKNVAAIQFQNVLFHNLGTVLWQTGSTVSSGELVTVDAAGYLNYTLGGATLGLTNSLVYNTTYVTGVSSTATYYPGAGAGTIFLSAGAGAHYLNTANNSVVNYTPTFLYTAILTQELPLTTVYPPAALSGPLTNNLVVGPVNRASGLDWVGYHYWPIDALGTGLVVTNSTLMLTNGAVIAFGGTNATGILLQSGAKFISQGRPDALNRLVWASSVQEQAIAGSGGTYRRMFYLTNSPTVRPDIMLRFTRSDFTANTSNRRLLIDDGGYFVNSATLRDSQFFGAKISLQPVGTPMAPTTTFGITNNVFDTCDTTFGHYYDEYVTANLFNNLFVNGSLSLSYASNAMGVNPTWTVKDNLFVGTSFSGSSGFIDAGWNGYTAASAYWSGGGNKTSIVPDWTTGPLGPWYYPTNATPTGLTTNLFNKGSRLATVACLYHYTTFPTASKEAGSQVDIGFHYSPCDVVVVCDADKDGVSDVVEDTNGNGIADADEYNWQVYDTDGDGLSDGDEMAAYGQGQVVSWGSLGTATDSKANPPALTTYIAVSAGASHNIALKEGGTAFAWGNNTYGQTNLPANAINLVAVAAGARHNLALQENGTLVAWGDNASGQTNLPSPNTNFTAIAAGGQHSLALKSDTTVIAWGDNTFGQATVPAGLTNVAYIAAGTNHSVALKTDGTLVAWGDNAAGQTNVTGITNVASVAAGARHTAVLKTDGSVTIVGDCAAPPAVFNNVLALAAGHRFTVALKNDYTLVAWGDNAAGQTNIPAGLTNIQALACGPSRTVALPYTPVLSYPVDVRRDFLVIYNTNNVGSAQVKDYYLANRPRITGCPVLGLGMVTNYTATTLFSGTQGKDMLFDPVQQWYAANPTLRPRHVLLSWGVPIWWTNVTGWSGPGGSSQNILREQSPGRRAFLGALNTETTNDAKAYIDKLASFGTNNPLNRIVLSASKTGYENRTYALSDYYPTNDLPIQNFYGRTLLFTNAANRLLQQGVPTTNLTYIYGRSYSGVHNDGSLPLTNVVSPSAVMNWGVYQGNTTGIHTNWTSGWPTNGVLNFQSDASWYLLQSIESFNGNFDAANGWQSKYTSWFRGNAFGGTNYNRTPVGAMSHVYEPTAEGANDTGTWMTLWHLRKPLGLSTCLAKDEAAKRKPIESTNDQTTGDPLVTR